MDKEKEIKLVNYYKEMPEQQLLELLSEDEDKFEDGAYTLLFEEAKRRGLEDKLNEIGVNKEQKIAEEKIISEARKSNYKFIKIFTTPNMGEMAVIKSILDNEKMPYFIKGEHFGALYGYADGLGAVEVMVREDYAEDAKELLKDFINPQSKGAA